MKNYLFVTPLKTRAKPYFVENKLMLQKQIQYAENSIFFILKGFKTMRLVSIYISLVRYKKL